MLQSYLHAMLFVSSVYSVSVWMCMATYRETNNSQCPIEKSNQHYSVDIHLMDLVLQRSRIPLLKTNVCAYIYTVNYDI